MKTPDYYLPIMPYLVIDNAMAFIEYIKKVFDAQEKYLHKHDDGSVMHAEFSIGKAVIMFTDSKKEYKAFPGGMFLVTSDVDEFMPKAWLMAARLRRNRAIATMVAALVSRTLSAINGGFARRNKNYPIADTFVRLWPDI
ncbi:hypothetical protein SAMN04488109_3582 [Chryseolinea serpens]|uniref:Uncharacterized protein n=1 Tax=Chryseolinea serpens TaxID=947013 RepID=A0A1M5RUD8_9BACT|nr:hypothetical protein [Chryseolinea serpens]SHH29800.1 hypothetical protein SAMN04488109_3582 [Chryseolinea serpens]